MAKKSVAKHVESVELCPCGCKEEVTETKYYVKLPDGRKLRSRDCDRRWEKANSMLTASTAEFSTT